MIMHSKSENPTKTIALSMIDERTPKQEHDNENADIKQRRNNKKTQSVVKKKEREKEDEQ